MSRQVTINLKAVRQISRAIRRAMEGDHQPRMSPLLRTFPNGCCHAASLLLGTRLHDCGLGQPLLVTGRRNFGSTTLTHTWLQLHNLVIDITADQFNSHPLISDRWGYRNPVEISLDASSWRKTFRTADTVNSIKVAHLYKFSDLGSPIKHEMLQRDYRILLRHI